MPINAAVAAIFMGWLQLVMSCRRASKFNWNRSFFSRAALRHAKTWSLLQWVAITRCTYWNAVWILRITGNNKILHGSKEQRICWTFPHSSVSNFFWFPFHEQIREWLVEHKHPNIRHPPYVFNQSKLWKNKRSCNNREHFMFSNFQRNSKHNVLQIKNK